MSPAGGPSSRATPAPAPAAKTARREPRDAVMQRVRVGLTGLAAVFLLTLLAASIFNMLGQDDHAPRVVAGSVPGTPEEQPREPLAELGMAPGNAPKTPPSRPLLTLAPPAPSGPGLVPAVPAAHR